MEISTVETDKISIGMFNLKALPAELLVSKMILTSTSFEASLSLAEFTAVTV
jgi:hypothetical protein